MEMKTNYKKALKIVTLLISSLLIATASADILNQMFMNATVGVEGLTLKWVLGNDATSAGASINQATCTMTALKSPAGQTRVYEDPVRLNNSGGNPVAFNITVQECSGSTANLTSIVVGLYNVTNSASIANLTIWNGIIGGPWTSLPQIPSQNEWKFQWEITWATNATTSDSATVKLVFDVG